MTLLRHCTSVDCTVTLDIAVVALTFSCIIWLLEITRETTSHPEFALLISGVVLVETGA